MGSFTRYKNIYGSLVRGESMIWESIVTYLSQNSMIDLLSASKKSQSFMIADIKEDYVKIQFPNSRNTLKFEKSRFISAYEMLKENKGKWVRIGG